MKIEIFGKGDPILKLMLVEDEGWIYMAITKDGKTPSPQGRLLAINTRTGQVSRCRGVSKDYGLPLNDKSQVDDFYGDF